MPFFAAYPKFGIAKRQCLTVIGDHESNFTLPLPAEKMQLGKSCSHGPLACGARAAHAMGIVSPRETLESNFSKNSENLDPLRSRVMTRFSRFSFTLNPLM